VSKPLKLAADEWPPFTDVASKPRRALALVEAALRRGNVRSDFSILKWTSAIALAKKGHFDGMAAIWKTPEREQYLLFSKPYLQNRLLLVARRGTDVSMASLAPLAGKRLALTNGYGYGEAVNGYENVKVIHYDTDADCLRAVLSNQADYVLLDELIVHYIYENYKDKAEKLLAVGSTPIEEHTLHLALRRDYPGAAEILAEFDRNVERMLADGSYNVLLDVPWISTDTNGDGNPEYVASSRAASGAAGDPSQTRAGYPMFNDSAHAPSTGRAPAYVIDGKSYDTWGDAKVSLQRVDSARPESDPYRYATGFVLTEF
jgi:polar amino acid transport system substrate-binding protein